MNQKPKNKNLKYLILTFGIIILFALMFIPSMMNNSRNSSTSYSDFLQQVEQHEVEKVTIEGDTISYTTDADDRKVYITQRVEDPNLVDRLIAGGVEFTEVPVRQNSFLTSFLITFAPYLLLWFGLWWMFRSFRKKMNNSMGGGGFTFTNPNSDDNGDDDEDGNSGGGFPFGGFGGFGQNEKTNAKVYKGEMTHTTFKDVAGQDEAKQNLKEIVSFLNNPGRYNEIGAKMPKGALLVGPPGTGKTLLARAVAGEAGVPFYFIAGSEFVEMFVGRGAKRVRDLFKEARKHAPCIVFIDEIDTIGKKRDGSGFNGNDEREQTLNQLLAEMDGFDGSKGIVLLAATNRPDSLDPALTRPGRFDRRIPVELPDLEGREAILQLHAKNVKMAPNIDFNMIARASAGTSGADLANIINEGALLAVRDGRKQVAQRDLEEAIEIVIAGEQKKNKVISPKERMIVSYHEIGHALVSAKSSHAAPVHKITIIPRTKGALGYTMQVDEQENNLLSKEELYTRIVTYCGGRAAEDLVFHSITSGASNDIEMATKTARMMIARLGMSDHFGMTALETVNNQYLGGDTSLACSPETSAQIDQEVIALIDKAYKEACQILSDNMMKLHELAKYLYEKETITGEEFLEILNRE
ncbi:ATP-dependent zinc metalloprotease FtsH [Allobaculum stercoricanis]|uniref:ATP-dependent zinc metalloprotease FtsH n=1 Tax=Allobaculum stercoricanis TaxID=174709 RepID=UPI002942EA04|nr:ATP-dependent zinc metalloprotease FtsH [Allobaculum stercoricanis]